MQVLFAICSWGLGHAVRDLPLIKRMVQDGHQISIVGQGRSLEFIKKELGRKHTYYEISDYSPVYSVKAFSVTKFVGKVPFYLREVKQR